MLEILRSIIQKVARTRDFREALNIMVTNVASALASQSCSIFLLDRRRGEYILMATEGLNPEAVGKVRIPINQGLIGLVGDREEPLNLSHAPQHEHFLRVPEVGEEIYQAFLGAPVIYHRQVLGVLIVQQPEPRRYDDAEEAFLVTVATQLAAIIAHAEATGVIAELRAEVDAVESGHAASLGKAVRSGKKILEENTWSGIPGAPGIGMGSGVVVSVTVDFTSVSDRAPDDVESEIRLLDAALAAGREDFRIISQRLYENLPMEEHALFDVYQRILDANDLREEIVAEIRRGRWAQGALRHVIESHVEKLEMLDNDYLSERAIDIRSLGLRVLAFLQRNEKILPEYAENTILVGEELTAADLAEVPEGCLRGVISARGSGSSHLAILARAMGVPTVMGASELPVQNLQGKYIIVDGYYGQIYVSPHAALREEFEHLAGEEREFAAVLESMRDTPAQLANGERISLMVNSGLGTDVSLSLAAGAEGLGLYRTETPFLMRDRFPSGEEQRVMYRQLLTAFSPRQVTMRTLDIGGDKQLPYFPVHEENPFLGWRGVRITLDHPDIFLTQVRAMLRASRGFHNLRIMLPMITDVSEVDECLRLLKKAHAEVCHELEGIDMPSVGVMIEVPAAVYQARVIARRVDFLSVGSNDLTQYLLAVDRNNARVAGLFDSLHPAVLRALQQVVEAGHQEGKHVSICGEIAGDPVAVLLLVAMGFDSLSMSASSLGRIKWVLRHFNRVKAVRLLQAVMEMESPVMIRCHMELALEQAGLGRLIRAGKG